MIDAATVRGLLEEFDRIDEALTGVHNILTLDETGKAHVDYAVSLIEEAQKGPEE